MTARAPAFGTPGRDFALGVEEELLTVGKTALALAHTGVDALSRLNVPAGDGSAHPDTYAALIELASPVCANAEEGVARIAALRARARDAGATLIGAGDRPRGDRAGAPLRAGARVRRRAGATGARPGRGRGRRPPARGLRARRHARGAGAPGRRDGRRVVGLVS